MKIEKNNMRGITLIALIVTIIVLLILAAISITMLTGQNSILNRASEAKNKTGVSQEEETVKLSISDALTQGLGTISTENLQNALRNNGLNGPLTGDGPWTYTGEYKKYNIEKSGSVTSKEQNSASSDKIVQVVGDYGVTEDNRLLKLEKEEKEIVEVSEKVDSRWFKVLKGDPVEEIGEIEKVYDGFGSYYIINTNGEIYAWGDNQFGQLGIGNKENQINPVKISGLTNIEKIYIEDGSTFAKTKNGEVYAWGFNYFGQLGIGNEQNQSTPVKINGMVKVEELYIGGSSNFAKTNDGEIYAWGVNWDGELGIGNEQNQSTPVKIAGLIDIEELYIGGTRNFAKNKNGEIYAWGNNQDGQLGIGNTENQSLPVKINGLSDIEKLYIGGSSNFAKNKNGEIYAWGNNQDGQLGIGNTENQNTPIKVDGLSDVSEILYCAYVIKNDNRIYLISGPTNNTPELIDNQIPSFKEADEIISQIEIAENRYEIYYYYYTNKNNIYLFRSIYTPPAPN